MVICRLFMSVFLNVCTVTLLDSDTITNSKEIVFFISFFYEGKKDPDL
jgi:hypothetical protein